MESAPLGVATTAKHLDPLYRSKDLESMAERYLYGSTGTPKIEATTKHHPNQENEMSKSPATKTPTTSNGRKGFGLLLAAGLLFTLAIPAAGGAITSGSAALDDGGFCIGASSDEGKYTGTAGPKGCTFGSEAPVEQSPQTAIGSVSFAFGSYTYEAGADYAMQITEVSTGEVLISDAGTFSVDGTMPDSMMGNTYEGRKITVRNGVPVTPAYRVDLSVDGLGSYSYQFEEDAEGVVTEYWTDLKSIGYPMLDIVRGKLVPAEPLG